MSRLTVEQIADAMRRLTLDQRNQLLEELQESSDDRAVGAAPSLDEIREGRFKDGIYCVYCHDKHLRKVGKQAGRQRYQCVKCSRTFCDVTNTPMYRTRYPDKWPNYLRCMIQGYPLQKSAELTGISLSTSFEWRHKILHALTLIASGKFSGIVEAGETYGLFSAKGCRTIDRGPRHRGGKATKSGISGEQVCVLAVRGRDKMTLGRTMGLGRLNSKSLVRVLGSRLPDEGITLCSDGGTPFITFCHKYKLLHKKVNLNTGVRISEGIYHIQNVNAVHGRFRNWSKRFNGVATKYLDNYWAWFELLDRTKGMKDSERAIRFMLDAMSTVSRVNGKNLSQYHHCHFMELCV